MRVPLALPNHLNSARGVRRCLTSPLCGCCGLNRVGYPTGAAKERRWASEARSFRGLY